MSDFSVGLVGCGCRLDAPFGIETQGWVVEFEFERAYWSAELLVADNVCDGFLAPGFAGVENITLEVDGAVESCGLLFAATFLEDFLEELVLSQGSSVGQVCVFVGVAVFAQVHRQRAEPSATC